MKLNLSIKCSCDIAIGTFTVFMTESERLTGIKGAMEIITCWSGPTEHKGLGTTGVGSIKSVLVACKQI